MAADRLCVRDANPGTVAFTVQGKTTRTRRGVSNCPNLLNFVHRNPMRYFIKISELLGGLFIWAILVFGWTVENGGGTGVLVLAVFSLVACLLVVARSYLSFMFADSYVKAVVTTIQAIAMEIPELQDNLVRDCIAHAMSKELYIHQAIKNKDSVRLVSLRLMKAVVENQAIMGRFIVREDGLANLRLSQLIENEIEANAVLRR